ncbi:MAG: transporter [Rhizomicrobium sp.]
MHRHRFRAFLLALPALGAASPCLAGPPYVTDDPEPTDTGHYEIYAFADGTRTRDGGSGEAGIDFNYGAAADLQLTAVLPLGYDDPVTGRVAAGLGNIELAAKFKILHQDDFGWDVAVFPRLFLPAGSGRLGARHASLLLPIWVGRNWRNWDTFGGGGCTLDNGGGTKDFCTLGWALTRQVLPRLQLGAEIYHQTAEMRGGRAMTGIGAGAIYDLSDRYHLMASYGPGIQNAAATDRASWYAAMLFTF